MLYCKSRQMNIRNQVRGGFSAGKGLLKYLPVVFRGSNNPCAGLFQPTLHTGDRLFKRQRPIKDPTICSYTDEGG